MLSRRPLYESPSAFSEVAYKSIREGDGVTPYEGPQINALEARIYL